jgi:hypothetical protein
VSILPSNAIASAAQTTGAQSRAAAAKHAEAVSTDTSAGAFSDQLSLTIQETDTDSRVFADAEGQGSFGRGDEKLPAAEEEAEEQPGDEGQPGGIDVTA